MSSSARFRSPGHRRSEVRTSHSAWYDEAFLARLASYVRSCTPRVRVAGLPPLNRDILLEGPLVIAPPVILVVAESHVSFGQVGCKLQHLFHSRLRSRKLACPTELMGEPDAATRERRPRRQLVRACSTRRTTRFVLERPRTSMGG